MSSASIWSSHRNFEQDADFRVDAKVFVIHLQNAPELLALLWLLMTLVS